MKSRSFIFKIDTHGYNDSMMLKKALFTESEVEAIEGGYAANVTIQHGQEAYPCVSHYSTMDSSFIVFTVSPGDESNPYRQVYQINNVLDKYIKDIRYYSEYTVNKTVVLVTRHHAGYKLTDEQLAKLEQIKTGYHVQHTFHLTDYDTAKGEKGLAAVPVNELPLKQIRELLLTTMVNTTHTVNEVKELIRAENEERQREAEEAARINEKERLEKERIAKEKEIEEERRREHERNESRKESLNDWFNMVDQSKYKANAADLYQLIGETKDLQLMELQISEQSFLLYLLEHREKWNEFTELMKQDKVVRIKSIIFSSFNEIMARVDVEKFDQFCEAYKLDLLAVNKLRCVRDGLSLIKFAMANYEKYPHFIGWIINNSQELYALHTAIITMEYDSATHIAKFANESHANYIEKLLSSKLIANLNQKNIFKDLKIISEDNKSFFDRIIALDDVVEGLLLLAKSVTPENAKRLKLSNEIFDFAKNHEARNDFNTKIGQLEQYGQTLKTAGRSEAGDKCIALAQEIKQKVIAYLDGGLDKAAASKGVNDAVAKGMSTMSGDRRWMDYVAPILVCCTGIGLIVVAVRVLMTHQFFFNQTAREKLLDKVNASWHRFTVSQ